ncbi:MAG: S8 family serine peptidase [Bryobacteraceae bacterium]
MSFGKYALGLSLAFGCAISAQVVPDWFVLELDERPTERTRGVRRIRDAQAAVRGTMAARLGGRAEIKDSTEVVMNALIVQSRAGEAELAALPGVRRVWPVYEIHPELDRAVGLLRIDKAWEAVGGTERAGAGMKIGIIDSGLDLNHPGFQTSAMSAPQGYPRASNEEIRGLLNGKVIVYRTYDQMLGFAESAADNSGHGTGVAMAAAGMRVKSPLSEIQGAAPGAWLGIYKVFVGPNGGSSNTAVATKALDDAAADGMDVVNMSFGFLPQIRADFDPVAPALARAASLGVMIVKSYGNSGPVRLSGSGPAVGSAGLTVGASSTDRIFASGIRVNGSDPLAAPAGDGPKPGSPINAPLKDAAAIDSTGLACAPLPAGSLAGAAALILRGECSFESKINAAQAAGAVAAIIYTHAQSPNAAGMLVGGATLPAVMISHRDGLRVKSILVEQPNSIVDMTFDDSLAFAVDSNGISGFSSRGPGADGGVRPDLLAVGEDILTAAQKTNRNGELYGESGFTLTNGTSFSSPLVAGAYAVLKAGRPGLRAGQYGSLLVNTAQPFPAAESRPASVQDGGSGRLDLNAALRGQLAMDPPSISFGLGGRRVDAGRTIRVQNTGASVGTWKLEVDSADEVKMTVAPTEFSLGVSDTIDLDVRLSGDLQLGEYQGFLLFRRVDAPAEERPQRVAYWYGVPTGKPATVSVIPSAPATAAAGGVVSITVLITDSIGASTPFETPKVTVLEGAAEFLEATSEESRYPGYWSIRLRMGANSGQTNRFRIEAGAVVREFSIRTR